MSWKDDWRNGLHIYFFQTFAEARVTPDLQQIHPAHHPAAEIINHARDHGITISIPWGMMEAELRIVLHYGAHSSAGKEVNFVHHKISDQVQAGQTVFVPLSAVHGLPKL